MMKTDRINPKQDRKNPVFPYSEMKDTTVQETQIKLVPQDQRPRERLLRSGPQILSDRELIALLIGSGTRTKGVYQLADEILEIFDRSSGAPEIETLLSVRGLGHAKAAILSGAVEFARRVLLPANRRIRYPKDLLPTIRHYAQRKQETFLAVSLNGAHEVIACRIVSIGLVNRTLVHPREVYADALTDRAAALVVAHNHPSGRVDPSPEDCEVTARLRDAGDTLGIKLLDHVIFSEDGYYSFLESGTL
jgi:DNA repair protein RadC